MIVSLSANDCTANARRLVNVSVYSSTSPGLALTVVPGPSDCVMFVTCFASAAAVKVVVTEFDGSVSPPYCVGSNGTLARAVFTAVPLVAFGVPTTLSVAVAPALKLVTVATTVCAPPADVIVHVPAPPVTVHDGSVVAE